MNRAARPPLRTLIYTCWWLLLAGGIVLLVLALPGYFLDWIPELLTNSLTPALRRLHTLASITASLFCVLLSFGLATLLFLRRRREGIALFISFFLLLYGAVLGGPLEVAAKFWGLSPNLVLRAQAISLTLPTLILFAVFPDGRFVPRWTVWLIPGALLVNLAMALSPMEIMTTFADLPSQLLTTALLLLLGAGMYAQIYRFRNVSGTVQRQQTKWVITGFFAWVSYIGLSTIPYTALQSLPPGSPVPWWAPFSTIGWWLSLSILPLSLAFGILRYRLWDIDVLIRRTLSYALLTGLLGLVYFGGVVLLQGIFAGLGSAADSPLVTVLSTLGIAALFNPLRLRVQDFIDRRFYRSQYDAERTLARFAAATRDEVDFQRMSAALLKAVDETMQPEDTSLWIIKAQEMDR